jgi:hypothetical protein
VVREADVPLPSVEANTPSNKDDPETTTTQGSAGDTVVAQPILVSDDSRNETSSTSILWKINKKWSLAAWLLSATAGSKMV